MLEEIKTISGIVLPALTFILSLTMNIRSERRIMRKERDEKMVKENSGESALPPRKTKHR
jgi:hypothetical protein